MKARRHLSVLVLAVTLCWVSVLARPTNLPPSAWDHLKRSGIARVDEEESPLLVPNNEALAPELHYFTKRAPKSSKAGIIILVAFVAPLGALVLYGLYSCCVKRPCGIFFDAWRYERTGILSPRETFLVCCSCCCFWVLDWERDRRGVRRRVDLNKADVLCLRTPVRNTAPYPIYPPFVPSQPLSGQVITTNDTPVTNPLPPADNTQPSPLAMTTPASTRTLDPPSPTPHFAPALTPDVPVSNGESEPRFCQDGRD